MILSNSYQKNLSDMINSNKRYFFALTNECPHMKISSQSKLTQTTRSI